MPFTVKKTFEAARETGNILIAQVKDNQSALLSTLEALCAGASPDSHHETVDRKRHGRQEHRLVEIFDVEGKLDPDWNLFVTAAARVTRLTWRKDTKTGFWAQSEEVAFYACQTKLSAETAGHAIRNHWGIENRLNHVRDVIGRSRLDHQVEIVLDGAEAYGAKPRSTGRLR